MKNKIAKSSTTWLFVGLCWLAYSTSYIARLDFSASMAEMTSSGVLLKSQAGAVTTGFFICYGCGQLLSGFLGDRFKPRYLVFTGLVSTSLINTAISFGPELWLMIALWSLNGLAQALLWAPICKTVADRVTSARRQTACTVLATTMAVGTLLAYILSAALISAYGWYASFRCAGIVTICCAVIWIIFMTKVENDTDKNGIIEEMAPQQPDYEGEEVPHEEVPKNIITLMLVSGLAVLSLVGGVQGVLKDCMSTWVPTFITDMFSTTSVVSILTGTLLPIFGLFGPLFTNRIMMKTRDELSSVFILFAISTVSLAMLLLFGKSSIVISIIALAVTYACSLGQNMLIIGTIPMYFSKVGKVSTMTGILNSVSYLSTALISWLTGVFVDKTGWSIVMSGWLLLSVLAMIGTVFAKRKWNRFRRNLF